MNGSISFLRMKQFLYPLLTNIYLLFGTILLVKCEWIFRHVHNIFIELMNM